MGMNAPDHYYSRLKRLPALEQLHLVRCWEVPACLGELRALRTLRLQDTPFNTHVIDAAGQRERLSTALRLLTSQLTHLSLVEHQLPLPECLPEMARLERFCWHGSLEGDFGLPPGPWLRSLCQAALPAHIAADSLDVLSAAARLETLALFHCSGDGAAAAFEVAAWAAQRVGLRTLELWPVGLQLRACPVHAWRELDAGLAHLRVPPTLRLVRSNELALELALLSDADA